MITFPSHVKLTKIDGKYILLDKKKNKFLGKSVDLCIGVRSAPFGSHARMEIDGNPVDEDVKCLQKIDVI